MVVNNLGSLGQLREELNSGTKYSASSTKALEDLKFLCSRLDYTLLHNVKYQALYDYSNTKHADLLVLHHDMNKSSTVTMPADLIAFDDPSMYVAVVVYYGDDVQDAFVFQSSEFNKKLGFFSPFKHDKGKGVCSINMKKAIGKKEYSFGNVFKARGKVTG